MNAAKQLSDIYRETVLEHSRHPRNFRRPERADRTAQGHNPLCGDKVTVYLKLDGDRLSDVAFEGTGCAISLASASIMTESLTGESVGAAREKISDLMHAFEAHEDNPPEIAGDMAALGGVRNYPTRIRCATLAWKALDAGLANDNATVTTED